MAIPTQFSVTKQAKRPIANPNNAQDLANVIGAESIGFVSGASSLPTKSPSETGNAVAIGSELIPEQDNASLVGALSVASINNPSLVGSQSVPAQDNASALPVISQADIDDASAASAQTAPAFSAPSAITSNAGTSISPSFPLNHARILYDNLLTNYQELTVSDGDNGSYALIPNTYQKWDVTSSSTETIIILLPNNVYMDTFCIGAHNLFGAQSSQATPYKFSYSSAEEGTFVNVAAFATPTSNDAIMVHVETPISVKKLKLEISPSPLRSKQIGYISGGMALQMQRPFFNGHQPYADSGVTEYYSNRTESGEIIGRQIRRRGFETTFEWNNLSDEWYRTYIPEFKESAKLRPMFVAWNLLEYPDDVAFGETTGDFSTSMQNGTMIKRSSLSFTLKGV
jgi:hypothetical protein